MRRFAILCLLIAWATPNPIQAKTVFYKTDLPVTVKYVTNPSFEELNKPVQQAPRPKVTNTQTIKPKANSGRNNTTLQATKFAAGYCTDYVAQRVKVTWRGNANQWLKNAKSQGYQVDRTPLKGAILVTSESKFGHVAYIESTDGHSITISEWNYRGRFTLSTRTLDISNPIIKGIIHVNN